MQIFLHNEKHTFACYYTIKLFLFYYFLKIYLCQTIQLNEFRIYVELIQTDLLLMYMNLEIHIVWKESRTDIFLYSYKIERNKGKN